MERKPIGETNIWNIVILAAVFAFLSGALTEKLIWFIGTLMTTPLVIVLLFAMWYKYGHDGVKLNSMNCFIMIIMFTLYMYIPLLSVTWGTWFSWFTFAIYCFVYLISFILREKLLLKFSELNEATRGFLTAILIFYLIILGLGIISWLLIIKTMDNGDTVGGFFFISMLTTFMSLPLSPMFLLEPKRVLELGVITQDYYDKFR